FPAAGELVGELLREPVQWGRRPERDPALARPLRRDPLRDLVPERVEIVGGGGMREEQSRDRGGDSREDRGGGRSSQPPPAPPRGRRSGPRGPRCRRRS